MGDRAEPGTVGANSVPSRKRTLRGGRFRLDCGAMKKTREVEREVRDLGWWYQHFQLPTGVWTGNGEDPAYKPETRWKIIERYIPQDLSGQTVLDVGGNAGFFSIQMRLRGAERCVLVEPYQEFSRQAQYASREFGAKLEIVNED